MTVIAYKNGILAADSGSFSDRLVRTSSFKKIVRCIDGSLAAACGHAADCYVFNKWISETNDVFGPRPKMSESPDTESCIILIDASGVVYMAHANDPWHPVSWPRAIGENSAAVFAEGAMAAGASAEQAVRLAIEHCVYAHGEVQVERLRVASLAAE